MPWCRVVGPGVEHPGVRAVPGNAFALEIGDMLRQRRRTKAAAPVTHDARLDHNAPSWVEEAAAAEGGPAAPKAGTARRAGSARSRRSLDGRPRFPGRLQDLGDEALRLGRLRRARSARPNPELVLAPAHRAAPPRWTVGRERQCAGRSFEIVENNRATCHRPPALPAKRQAATAAWMPAWQGLLTCPLSVGS